jgi:hypothetical protein
MQVESGRVVGALRNWSVMQRAQELVTVTVAWLIG